MVENGLNHPKPELSGEKLMSLKDLVGSFYTNMEMDRTEACQGTRGTKKNKKLREILIVGPYSKKTIKING